MRKVLFVTSEAHPLMKTGGLGDVCGSLPGALRARELDVRLLLPGYRDSIAAAGPLKRVAEWTLPPMAAPVALLEGRLPGTRVPVWLIDFPPAYDRPGNPYQSSLGHDWHDNATRFALLGKVAAALALGNVPRLRWQPDIVHCHDWQSGLAPALLAGASKRPATVFTIHNLAYQGLFPYETFQALNLPTELWSMDGLEFHGQMSFIKGGIAYADRVTTVSPNYAREIQTPEFGHGLDGLLRHRTTALRGILNGIDPREWNPARDPHLAAPYSAGRLAGKAAAKAALQADTGLPTEPGVLLAGIVSRLVTQKGLDLLLEALPALLELPMQLVVRGTGESRFEQELWDMAQENPQRLSVHIGYDEVHAHRLIAGADLFLMPSRFEPCGLTQLYSLRYGTVPLVHRVGGLADTVVDADDAALADGSATGIAFSAPNSAALLHAVTRALGLFRDKRRWRQMMQAGMKQDFSWQHSAADYLRLYDELVPPVAGAQATPWSTDRIER